MDDSSTVADIPAEEPTIDIDAPAVGTQMIFAQEVVPAELNFDREFEDTRQPNNELSRCQNETAKEGSKDISQVLAIPDQITPSPREVDQREIGAKVFDIIDLTDDQDEDLFSRAEPAVIISTGNVTNVEPANPSQSETSFSLNHCPEFRLERGNDENEKICNEDRSIWLSDLYEPISSEECFTDEEFNGDTTAGKSDKQIFNISTLTESSHLNSGKNTILVDEPDLNVDNRAEVEQLSFEVEISHSKSNVSTCIGDIKDVESDKDDQMTTKIDQMDTEQNWAESKATTVQTSRRLKLATEDKPSTNFPTPNLMSDGHDDVTDPSDISSNHKSSESNVATCIRNIKDFESDKSDQMTANLDQMDTDQNMAETKAADVQTEANTSRRLNLATEYNPPTNFPTPNLVSTNFPTPNLLSTNFSTPNLLSTNFPSPNLVNEGHDDVTDQSDVISNPENSNISARVELEEVAALEVESAMSRDLNCLLIAQHSKNLGFDNVTEPKSSARADTNNLDGNDLNNYMLEDGSVLKESEENAAMDFLSNPRATFVDKSQVPDVEVVVTKPVAKCQDDEIQVTCTTLQ